MPTNQTPFCPEGNSAQHMDHNNSTENTPNYSSSEKKLYTSHTNNIRIMGQYMVIYLCPPIPINEHIPNRTPAEQLHIQRAHYTVKMIWRSVQIMTNEPYFSQFVKAIS